MASGAKCPRLGQTGAWPPPRTPASAQPSAAWELRLARPRDRRGPGQLAGRRRAVGGRGRRRGPSRGAVVGRPRLRRTPGAAAGLEGRHGPPHPAARPAGAPRERQAGGGRDPRDRPRHRPHRLGRQARPPGARPAYRAQPAVDQPAGLAGVPAARRGRRDRAVELPGVHADGLDRLRAGRRQRRRLQAERVHPRGRRLARRLVRRGRARAAGAAARHRRSARPAPRCAGPASTRSPSPARPRPARRSWPPAPRR